MEPTQVAAIISLGVSWLCLTKVISKKGWQQWVWLVVGLFFFLSWLGNSFVYFGVLGWIISAVLTAIYGAIYGKDRKDKARN